jgi:hypothetical protein
VPFSRSSSRGLDQNRHGQQGDDPRLLQNLFALERE